MKKPPRKEAAKEKEKVDAFPMRINRYLAKQNHATRTGADELIKKGIVFVNGQKAILGDKVKKGDTVEVRRKEKLEEYVYLAYNKPVGVLTHGATAKETDVRKAINRSDVFPVGRLDRNSEGLLILTNDGRVTDRLLNPERVHEKEYVVQTKRPLPEHFEKRMAGGVNIGNGHTTKPCTVRRIGIRTFGIILTEGKKHQIRLMCEAMKAEVTKLQRIRVMNVELGNLAPGNYRILGGEELKTFLRSLGL
jgi:23S rRNA pseudouridine2604 synthase